jgi:hypothetical protein
LRDHRSSRASMDRGCVRHVDHKPMARWRNRVLVNEGVKD